MAEQEKNVATEQNEQNKNENEGKENKEMNEENEKNTEKGKVKEEKKKKPGKGKKLWNKIKDNGRVIGAAAGGIAFGILSTLGIEKLGEYFTNKKNMANAQDEQNTYYENNDDGTYNDN